MSRGYQNDRNSYDPYDQDYDSGYSRQTNEYKDLYNPYKSVWRQAVESQSPKQQERSYKVEGMRRVHSEGGTTQKSGITGYESGSYSKTSQGEGAASNSGYSVERKNTYGSQTTGYGPRD